MESGPYSSGSGTSTPYRAAADRNRAQPTDVGERDAVADEDDGSTTNDG